MAATEPAPDSLNGFWKIRPQEFILDLVLIGITIWLTHYFKLYSGTVTQENSTGIQIIIVIAQLSLPWYLGFLYGRYLVFYGGMIQKAVMLTAFIVFMMFIGFAGLYLSDLPKSSYLSGTDNLIFFAVFWVFAIMISPFLALSGKSAGKAYFKQAAEGDKNGSFYHIVFIFLGLVLFLIGLLFLKYYLGNFLGILAAFGLLAFILYFGNKVYGKLKSTYVVRIIDSIATYIFPFIILISLTVWSVICVQTAVTDNAGNPLSYRGILFILVFNGYIPLRLIQMFDPPLRILNLLLSIISLVLLFSVIH